ncbi:MAG: hypothetical protein JWO80_6233 [Bryobacterales bacterium]|nr:hypothetical protein [Bryobacterales bacterium]
MRSPVVFVTIALLGFAGSAVAQTPTGTLQGSVVDQSGGGVAGAVVRVTNVGTNEKKELQTDSSGRYVLPFLNPGTYTIEVEAKGFRTAREENVKIDVGQNRSADFAMTVGAVSESVQVEAAATPLDTNSATLGEVVDTKKVVDLPLNGRNPFSLATLVPGVNNVGGASTPHIGGSRNAVNEQQLDGVSNILPENNVGNNVSAYTPIVDSVAEFSVQTNSLSAEYGRFGGGVINLVTRSGTNQWHGGLFEFSRNAVLNANDFFANRAGRAKPDSNDRQYGGTFGGPIDIPRVYDGHNRSFFFGGFQGENASAAAITTDTVPLPAFRTGDFSSLGTTIYDPLTVHTDSVTGKMVRDPFPGNIIPAIRFDPVAVKALTYFPSPNAGGPGAQTNNFIATGSTSSNSYQFDSRVDHNFTDMWHMFVRLSHNWNDNTPLFDYGSSNPASQGGSGFVTGGAWSASMDHTITFTPTLVGDFRYGFARSYVTDTPLGAGFQLTSLGLPQSLQNVAAQRVLEFPRFAFSNGAGLGNTGYVDLIENPLAHSFTGSLTKITGRHSVKFGGEFRRLFINFTQYGYPDGQFNFDSTWTQQVLNSANGTGSPYASFLLGLPTGGQVTHEPTAADASSYMALYVQDDFKVTRTLTVNVGLRWDVEFPRTERYNRLSYWDPSLPSPIQGKVPAGACAYCGNLVGQMVFVGTPASKFGRNQGPIQWKDFGPRVGFAWNALDKTVIRSGFGIAYAPSALQAAGTTGAPGVQGFGGTTQVQTSFDNQVTIHSTLSNAFPDGYNLPLGAAGGPSTNLGLGIGESFFDSYRNPYSIEWNFNIQRQLPGDMTVEVAYLGNRGLFLVDGELGQPYSQLNPSNLALGNQLLTQVPNPFYGIITTPGSPLSQPTISYNRVLRPFPQYDGVSTFRKPRADSIYHGMTVRIDKRFSRGLTFLVAFTAGKSMDNSAAAVGYLGPIGATRADQYNDHLEWAVSPQDISRRLVTSFVYELPFGRGKQFVGSAPGVVNLLVSGWQANGILSWQTGTPIIIGGVVNQTNIFTAAQRPTNNGHSAALSNPTIDRWFDTSVFSQPAPFTIGNTGRTLPDARTPGIANADLSLFKNNYFGHESRYNLQFRIEAFNALNHAQFGSPNTSLQAGNSFGVITSTGVSARQVQLAAKFLF